MKTISKILSPTAAIFIGFGSLTVITNAATITLSANGVNRLVVSFTIPIQHPSHDALSIYVRQESGSSSFSATAALFDGIVPLHQSSITSSTGQSYGSVARYLSGTFPLIDYTSIADGTIDGVFTLDVISGTRVFDSSDIVVQPTAFGGWRSGFSGVVTSVVATAVPEPSLSLLIGLGVIYSVAIRRKRIQ